MTEEQLLYELRDILRAWPLASSRNERRNLAGRLMAAAADLNRLTL